MRSPNSRNSEKCESSAAKLPDPSNPETRGTPLIEVLRRLTDQIVRWYEEAKS